jgi:hypothetical protein
VAHDEDQELAKKLVLTNERWSIEYAPLSGTFQGIDGLRSKSQLAETGVEKRPLSFIAEASSLLAKAEKTAEEGNCAPTTAGSRDDVFCH